MQHNQEVCYQLAVGDVPHAQTWMFRWWSSRYGHWFYFLLHIELAEWTCRSYWGKRQRFFWPESACFKTLRSIYIIHSHILKPPFLEDLFVFTPISYCNLSQFRDGLATWTLEGKSSVVQWACEFHHYDSEVASRLLTLAFHFYWLQDGLWSYESKGIRWRVAGSFSFCEHLGTKHSLPRFSENHLDGSLCCPIPDATVMYVYIFLSRQSLCFIPASTLN